MPHSISWWITGKQKSQPKTGADIRPFVCVVRVSFVLYAVQARSKKRGMWVSYIFFFVEFVGRLFAWHSSMRCVRHLSTGLVETIPTQTFLGADSPVPGIVI